MRGGGPAAASGRRSPAAAAGRQRGGARAVSDDATVCMYRRAAATVVPRGLPGLLLGRGLAGGTHFTPIIGTKIHEDEQRLHATMIIIVPSRASSGTHALPRSALTYVKTARTTQIVPSAASRRPPRQGCMAGAVQRHTTRSPHVRIDQAPWRSVFSSHAAELSHLRNVCYLGPTNS